MCSYLKQIFLNENIILMSLFLYVWIVISQEVRRTLNDIKMIHFKKDTWVVSMIVKFFEFWVLIILQSIYKIFHKIDFYTFCKLSEPQNMHSTSHRRRKVKKHFFDMIRSALESSDCVLLDALRFISIRYLLVSLKSFFEFSSFNLCSSW